MFKMKYSITQKYLTAPSKRRSGIKMPKVRFIVVHDTGNPNSTAIGNVNYYENSRDRMSASAHIFVDDKNIIECIPAVTIAPEKAWHVLYSKLLDNKLFGDDANNVAIGIEYCFGNKINSDEAYKRFIWTIAYVCYKYKLSPEKDIVGHHILDPERKTDPESGLKFSGRSYQQLLRDIVIEYDKCTQKKTLPIKPVYKKEDKDFTIIVNERVLQTKGFFIGDRTYVPMREVCIAMGKTDKVGWNSVSKKAALNGQELETAKLVGDITFCWSRELISKVSGSVSWDSENRVLKFS